MDTVIGSTVAGVARAKATALVFDGRRSVMFEPNTSPANGTQAARDLIGDRAGFSHIKNGYPVYSIH